MSIVSITLVLFKAIISDLMYEEFEKGNCALSDIYAAMLYVSLSFGWLAYLQFEKGSLICGMNRLK